MMQKNFRFLTQKETFKKLLLLTSFCKSNNLAKANKIHDKEDRQD
jgi:hypothetical protein